MNTPAIIQPGITQEWIHGAQDILKEYPQIETSEDHYFADGVYARVMKVPAGSIIIGKPHKTEHISIMLKGRALITMDDGSVIEMCAPQIFVVPAGKKKMAEVLEEMWFVNIHPTDTRDLEVIESKVIMPEEEHKALISNSQVTMISQGE